MSLVYSYTDNYDTQVAVYKLPDKIDEPGLNKINERFGHFKSEQKRLEKYGIERLLDNLNIKSEVKYTADGKPFLSEGPHISITHTKKYVGIALNKNHNIGIDLEYPSSRVMKVLSRFLNKTELSMCEFQNYKSPLIMWCAKEATFKAFGNKKVSLLNNININDINDLNNFSVYLNFNNHKKTYNLHAVIKPEFFLAVSIEVNPK